MSNFGSVFQEMLLKDISYLELWWLFSPAQPNHLCNFGRGHYDEHFSEIILNLDQWLSWRCRFKTFRALLATLFSGEEPFVQFWTRA